MTFRLYSVHRKFCPRNFFCESNQAYGFFWVGRNSQLLDGRNHPPGQFCRIECKVPLGNALRSVRKMFNLFRHEGLFIVSALLAFNWLNHLMDRVCPDCGKCVRYRNRYKVISQLHAIGPRRHGACKKTGKPSAATDHHG